MIYNWMERIKLGSTFTEQARYSMRKHLPDLAWSNSLHHHRFESALFHGQSVKFDIQLALRIRTFFVALSKPIDPMRIENKLEETQIKILVWRITIIYFINNRTAIEHTQQYMKIDIAIQLIIVLQIKLMEFYLKIRQYKQRHQRK